jgi:hypothetical protein
LWTVCSGLPWTSILLISASQVASIKGVSHCAQTQRTVSESCCQWMVGCISMSIKKMEAGLTVLNITTRILGK